MANALSIINICYYFKGGKRLGAFSFLEAVHNLAVLGDSAFAEIMNSLLELIMAIRGCRHKVTGLRLLRIRLQG